MSRSTDPGHFFQSDASEAIRARRAAKSGNKNGSPIKLTSKLLAVAADPLDIRHIYVAESAGCVRHLVINTGRELAVFRGPTAPITSLALSADGLTLYAGSWDKDVYVWDTRKADEKPRRWKGHSDFVKAVITGRVGGKHVVISGGADKKIIVWDAETGEKMWTLKDQLDGMRAVQVLAVDLTVSMGDRLVLVSGSSDPLIRFWEVRPDGGNQILDVGEKGEVQGGKKEHETSVYGLCFEWTDGDGEGDLFTASADGFAKQLKRERNWKAGDAYEHGDYVRAVAVTDDWVVTAGRNEDVKVWDRSSGKLWHTYEGHFEEVTGLLVLPENQEQVISVSIDGTVRKWSLKKADLAKAIKEREDMEKGVVKEEKVEKKSLLTAEEEAELAELMSDSD